MQTNFKVVKEKGSFIIAMIKTKGGIGASTIAGNIVDNTKVKAYDMDTNAKVLSRMFPKRVPLVTSDTKEVKVRKGEVTLFDFGGDSDPRMREVLAYAELIITPINPDEVAVKGGQKAVRLVGQTNVPVIFVLTNINAGHKKSEIDGVLGVTQKLFGEEREMVSYTLKSRKPYTVFGEGKTPLLQRKSQVGDNLKTAREELNGLFKKIENYVELV